MSLKKFLKIEKAGCSLLIISMLLTSVAGGMFLPYIVNAWLEGTGISSYQKLGAAGFTLAGILGLMTALFMFGEKGNKRKKLVRLIIVFLIAAAVQVIWSLLIGGVSEQMFGNGQLSALEARKKVSQLTGLSYIPIRTIYLWMISGVMSGERFKHTLGIKSYTVMLVLCGLKYVVDQRLLAFGYDASGLIIQQISAGTMTALIIIIGIYMNERKKAVRDYKTIQLRGGAAA